MAEKHTGTATTRPEEKGLVQKERSTSNGPFRTLERFAKDVDRMFDDFGFGRGWLAPRFAFGGTRPLFGSAEGWLPDIEVLQRDHDLLVRADLPGLAKDAIKVEVTDEAITIRGERKREHEEEKAGVYRSERSYGTFSRVIGLPEGAMTDQAKATFKDGVLEITMPVPPESVKHRRRLEISEGASPKK